MGPGHVSRTGQRIGSGRDRFRGGAALELTALYVDFQDPASYRVWRWLSLLPLPERVEVRPFSLDSLDGGGAATTVEDRPPGPWDSTDPSWPLELLALGECARESGRPAHRRFVDAAFAAVHERRGDAAEPETWLRLGTELGVDLDRYTREGDRWRAEVGLWHREGADELGVEGVPTLVFDERRALRVELDDDVRDAGAAHRLLSTLGELAAQPVLEVRRSGRDGDR